MGGIMGLRNEVPPVRPGEGLQDGGRIAYVTRQGTDRGCKGGFRRIIVGHRNQAFGGMDANQAAQRGRQARGTAAVRTQTPRRHGGRKGSASAVGRASGRESVWTEERSQL